MQLEITGPQPTASHANPVKPVSIYYSAESVEWYTPSEILDAARKVLGNFDLDPASCKQANSVVQAKKFLSKEDDGLSKPWFGRVWLNPPFGRLGPKFAKKLVAEFESGNVHEAIFLANANALTARWFHPLLAYPICVPLGRTKFWNERGVGKAPGNGSLFVYLGPNSDRFVEHFSPFGTVLVPFQRQASVSLGVAA